MKRFLLVLTFLAASCASAFAQSSATEIELGFLSTATTGNAACSGTNNPCFVPYSTTNPMPTTTSGGGGGGASPAGQLNAIQAYATSSTFAGSSSGNGLYRSTTSQGLIFLSATTTANLLSLGNNGADVTSYALGESALLAQSTTNLDNTAIGGYALTAVTTGLKNTALGWDAGQVITVGTNNTIIGALVASTTLTTGNSNILIGVDNTVDTAISSTTSTLNIGNLLGGVLTNATHASKYPLTLTATGSGVQGFVMQNTPTGQAPILTVAGSDTNGTGLGIAINALNATATGIGGSITLTAGNGNSGAQNAGTLGGAITINSGAGPSGINGTYAGIITIQPGVSDAGTGNTAAALDLYGGNANGGNSNGGPVNVVGGTGNSSGAGGTASLTGGISGSAGAGGIGKVVGGAGNAGASGGAAQVTGGAGGSTGAGGAVTITSGAGGATSGVAGNVVLALGVTTSSAGGTLPSIQSGGFLQFTTTQAAIAAETGVHMVTNSKLALTATGVDEFTVAAGLVAIPNIASDATHTDNTICEDDTSHALYAGSGTGGICAGTSSRAFKNHIAPLNYGLTEIMQLEPEAFYYNQGHGDNGARLQFGFMAEDVNPILPNLVGKNADGKPINLDYMGLVPVVIRAIQEQQKELESIPAFQADPCHNLNWLGRELFCK